MTPRAWWRKKRNERKMFLRALGYGDGRDAYPHDRVGRDGSWQQSVYDLAYSRGRMERLQQEAREP